MRRALLLLTLFLVIPASTHAQRTHEAWTKHGRRLSLPSGQKVYTANVGQRNYDTGGDVYSTGDWDPLASPPTFSYGNGFELRFPIGDRGFELWFVNPDPDLQLFDVAFILQRQTGPNWNDLTVNLGVLTVLTPASTDACEETTFDYSLIHNLVEAEVTITVDCQQQLHVSVTVEAQNGGTYRLVLSTPQGVAATSPPCFTPAGACSAGPDGGTQIRYETETGGRWKMRIPERANTRVTNDTSALRMDVLEGSYTAGQRRTRSPDTYDCNGGCDVGLDVDDGELAVTNHGSCSAGDWEEIDGCYGNNNLYWERTNGNVIRTDFVSFRWRDIDLGTASPGVDSIDAGTQIIIVNAGDNNNATDLIGTLRAVDEGNPVVWDNTSNQPDTFTYTTASTAVTGSTGNQTVDAQGLVNELVITDSNPYTGSQAMSFSFELTSWTGEGTNRWWGASTDYDGAGSGVEATLTIEYTPTVAGGGTFPLVNNDPTMGLVNGGLTR